MVDQIAMVFSDVMDEAMSILQAMEATDAAATSSSTRRLKRHRHYVNYGHEAAHFMLRHDYLDNDFMYPIILSLEVSYADDYFLSIMHKYSKISPYFSERYNATDHIGLTVLQKYIVVVRQLVYDMTVDTIDKYLKLGKSITLKCLKYYCTN
jgi:hypothetical protein